MILVHFAKNKSFKKRINEVLKKAENDKEHYVKKAIIWLKNELKK